METSGGFVLLGEHAAGSSRCFDDWPMVGQGLREDVLVLYGLVWAWLTDGLLALAHGVLSAFTNELVARLASDCSYRTLAPRTWLKCRLFCLWPHRLAAADLLVLKDLACDTVLIHIWLTNHLLLLLLLFPDNSQRRQTLLRLLWSFICLRSSFNLFLWFVLDKIQDLVNGSVHDVHFVLEMCILTFICILLSRLKLRCRTAILLGRGWLNAADLGGILLFIGVWDIWIQWKSIVYPVVPISAFFRIWFRRAKSVMILWAHSSFLTGAEVLILVIVGCFVLSLLFVLLDGVRAWLLVGQLSVRYYHILILSFPCVLTLSSLFSLAIQRRTWRLLWHLAWAIRFLGLLLRNRRSSSLWWLWHVSLFASGLRLFSSCRDSQWFLLVFGSRSRAFGWCSLFSRSYRQHFSCVISLSIFSFLFCLFIVHYFRFQSFQNFLLHFLDRRLNWFSFCHLG